VSGSQKARVLVAGDDYYASLAAVRGLRKGGYEPWFATHSPITFAARSRATAGTFRLPKPSEAGDQAYVDALADAARRCGADVVLPGNELAIKAVASRRRLFPTGTIVAADSRETVDRATDKTLLAKLAAEVGIAAPTLDPSEPTFPAVVKPAMTATTGARGTRVSKEAQVVHTPEQLRSAVADGGNWLVQPYIEGRLIAVAGVAWRGEVVCSCHQAAQRIYPRPLGVSAYSETVPIDRELDSKLAQIVRRLGCSGIFEFQLIRSGDAAHVIDLNPRPYGSLALAIGAGLNLPSIWVDLLLGREPRIGRFRTGVRYRAEVREGRALVAAVARGRLREALAIARPRRRTVHSIFSVRDPVPMLAVLERATGRLAKAA
jgi:predicted ATP-grasp superfamily ATP-dependent carboligase